MDILSFLKSKKAVAFLGIFLALTAVSSLVLFSLGEDKKSKNEHQTTSENKIEKEEEEERTNTNSEKNNEKEVTEESQKIKGTEKSDEEKYSLTLLVNKDNPIPKDFKVKTTKIDDIPVDERIAGPLNNMIQAAYDKGMHLGVCSGYRDSNFQKMLFEREVTRLIKSGMGEESARAETSKSIAQPGKSEHECGLAVDFYAYSNQHANLSDYFERTIEGKFVKKVAPEYGFILRYPKGKEHITKYSYEPWHFRYVGSPLAKKITDSGLTFEEYHEKYLGGR